MGVFPCRVLTHYMIGIAIAVRFLIGLVHDVDAPAVTEFIKIFTIRIVAGAQEIDVGLLHQPEILLVGRIVDVAACAGMVVMTIDAAQFHVPPVNLEDLADALHLLHAQVVVKMFDDVALIVLQFHAEGIEVRFLG